MKFALQERGQSLIEYALILVLVVIVILLVIQLLGPAITRLYQNILLTI